ncbi:uncharacterized protein [Narcine bancroftii]|uniref:uncharacterized protein isoform X3 n=1 Tax=Narcine bancroftii TaxID=1343680 RepID=UPI0038318CF3
MERLIRPEKLDIDPRSATAFKAFNFWLLNFENFLRLIEVEEDNQCLTALLSMVSLRVYENIHDETTYPAAIKDLSIVRRANIYCPFLIAFKKIVKFTSMDNQDSYHIRFCKLEAGSMNLYLKNGTWKKFKNRKGGNIRHS